MRTIQEYADRPTDVQRTLTWGIFLAATGLVAYVCLAILRPFANVIAWTAVLAILCYPLHQRLVQRTGRVTVSALIISGLIVLACVVPLLLLGGVALKEGAAVGQWLHAMVQNGATPLAQVSARLARITAPFGLGQSEVEAKLQERLATLSRDAGQYATTVTSGLADGAVEMLLVVFATFLVLREGEQIVETIPNLLPFERRRTEALLRRVKDVVQASVYSVVVIAVLQGVLCGVMFAVLGIPTAALWGAVTMFASVLPVVGSFAVWGPGTVYLAMTGAWGRAIVLAVWGAIVVSGVDNVLRPRMVAGRVGLSELSMFFALLGGLSVFGGLGVVLGPVAFATAAAIVQTLRETPSTAQPMT